MKFGEKNSPGGPQGGYKQFKGNSFSGIFFCEFCAKWCYNVRAVHYGASKKKLAKTDILSPRYKQFSAVGVKKKFKNIFF